MDELEFEKAFPFEKPRPIQKLIAQHVSDAFESGKRHVLVEAPTGIGKSALAYTIACMRGSAYFLTVQKSLQAQYVKDFSDSFFGMASITGKANYRCARNDSLKCDMGVCSWKRKREKKCDDCPYYVARDWAYSANCTVMNYCYFLNMSVAPHTPQQKRGLIVLDECHQAEEQLLSFLTITLSHHDFHDFEVKSFPRFPDAKEDDKAKFSWLKEVALPALVDQLDDAKETFENMSEKSKTFRFQSRKCSYLDTLVCMANRMFVEIDSGTPGICMQDGPMSVSFRPLYARSLAKSYYYDFGDKTLMMSATVLSKDQFCNDMGLPPEETHYIVAPSIFKPENRPVYSFGIGNMGMAHREKTMPKLCAAVKKIMEKHEHQRGIIHTVSYEVTERILKEVGSDRFVVPRGKERGAILDEFMNSSRDDLVLLSPSLSEGIDLKDDLSRFTVICKVPFGNLGDKFIRTRMELDGKWYAVKTVCSIVQMTGRSVRHEDDKAVAYILDSAFSWFYAQNRTLFPQWWRDALIVPTKKH